MIEGAREDDVIHMYLSDAATGDEVAASSICFESKMILRMCCLNLELA